MSNPSTCGFPCDIRVHEGLGVIMRPIINYMAEALSVGSVFRGEIMDQAIEDIGLPVVRFTDIWAD